MRSLWVACLVAGTLGSSLAIAEPVPVLLNSWGTLGTGNGQFNGPYCVAVGPDDAVYVTDQTNARVEKFTRGGAFLTTWGTFGTAPGQFRKPVGICVGPNGTVYVVDNMNARVSAFSSSGAFLFQFGTGGGGNLGFIGPRDITVDTAGNLYVVDHGNHRIQKFDGAGGYLASIGVGYLSEPTGVAVSPSGVIFVADENAFINGIVKFSSAGALLQVWGGGGGVPGRFAGPGGVSLDRYGSVYVADHGNNRVQKFTPDGQLLSYWGEGQFLSPLDVELNRFDEVYVADTNNHRIVRYGYGPTAGTPVSWGAVKARYRGSPAPSAH